MEEEKKEEVVEETTQEKKKILNNKKEVKGKPLKIWLVVMIIIFMLITFGLGLYLGKQLYRKENKKSSNNNQPVEEKKEEDTKGNNSEKSVALIRYESTENTIKVIYNDDTVKTIKKGYIKDDYYLDNDVIYFKDLDNTIYSLNLKDESATAQKIEYDFSGAGVFHTFSVVDGVIYYLKRDNNQYYAYSYNINNKTEEKKQLNISYTGIIDYSDGETIYFIDNQHYGTEDAYSYNFKTNELKKIGNYYQLVENKGNYLLFFTLNSEKYCLYDKKNNKELYCVDSSKLEKTNQTYGSNPVIKDSSILFYTVNKIVECTSSNSCDKVLYSLTSEQQKAEYKDIKYFNDKLVLILGYGEHCYEGCGYDNYEYYDVLKNKELPYDVYKAGEGESVLTYFE